MRSGRRVKRRRDRECTIYIIAVNGSGPVKVGISSTPNERLRQLQTANPERLEIYKKLPVPSRYFAKEFEKTFHKNHRGRRLLGEWFSLHPAEAYKSLSDSLRDFFASLYGPEDVAKLMKAVGAE